MMHYYRKYINGSQKKVILKAVLVMLLWGSLFPCIKLGYKTFQTDTAFFPNLLLFAGIRFLIGGGAITAYCAAKRKPLKVSGAAHRLRILSVGIFAVVLHYSCTYIGLTMTDSSETALLKQLGVIFFICFSFLFFNEDKFSIQKLLGAVFGLAGIVVLNTESLKFSFGLGEVLIIAASVCTVIANISCKRLTAEVDAVVVTGYSQLLGGIVLTVIGLAFGGSIGSLSAAGAGVFAYICMASIFGYCIWYSLVGENDLSKLFVIKFLEPLFAALCGAILLGENIFNVRYLVAFVLVLGAVYFSNRPEKYAKQTEPRAVRQ